MAVSRGVDAAHMLAEEPTVRRSVTELIDRDIIMDHLMEDRVLDEFFRQIHLCIDTKGKILVTRGTKEPGAVTSKSKFSKKSAGMR